MNNLIQGFLLFFMLFFYAFIVYFSLIDGVTISENIILLTMAGVIGISFLSDQLS